MEEPTSIKEESPNTTEPLISFSISTFDNSIEMVGLNDKGSQTRYKWTNCEYLDVLAFSSFITSDWNTRTRELGPYAVVFDADDGTWITVTTAQEAKNMNEAFTQMLAYVGFSLFQ